MITFMMVKIQNFSFNEVFLYDYKVYGYIVLNIWTKIILNEYSTKYGLESSEKFNSMRLVLVNFFLFIKIR